MNANRSIQIGPPRFSIAVHSLVWLAQKGCVLSSSSIACQVNSHATFLRRVLALLSNSGIVAAKEGRDGGYVLKIPPEKLTLAEIYLAVRSEEVHIDEGLDCGATGEQIDNMLEGIMKEAEARTIALLEQYTLQDIRQKIDFR